MSKTFRFEYHDFEDNDEDDFSIPYPLSSDLAATHTFADGVTWDVILWQFCKFLENSGYAGVTEQIKLVDKYGTKQLNSLFECLPNEDDDIFADCPDSEEPWPFDIEVYETALDRKDGDAT